MEGSIGPVPAGGPSPLTAHNVTPDSGAISPATVGVATLLMQQAFKDVHGMATHIARQLDSSAARVGSNLIPSAGSPATVIPGMGAVRVWG